MTTPDDAAQRMVAAIQAWDGSAYNAAGRALIDACELRVRVLRAGAG